MSHLGRPNGQVCAASCGAVVMIGIYCIRVVLYVLRSRCYSVMLTFCMDAVRLHHHNRQVVPKLSLAPVAEAVSKKLGLPVAFAPDCVGVSEAKRLPSSLRVGML